MPMGMSSWCGTLTILSSASSTRPEPAPAKAGAERFVAEMRERLAAFALTLHGEKTRLIRFGRYAAQNRRERGEGKPETFNFLGFTHICGRSRRGGFLLKRTTRRDRMQARLLAIQEGLRRRMHTTIEEQGDWLRQVMGGSLSTTPYPPTPMPGGRSGTT